jgi:chromosomal replication initiator protein
MEQKRSFVDMNALVRILKTLFGTTTEQTSTVSDIDKIINATTEVTGVTRLQMLSKRREKEYVQARWIAMYVAREMTTMSLPEIGRKMQRDHTTVLYAIEKISKRGRGATKLNRDIAKIKQLVA